MGLKEFRKQAVVLVRRHCGCTSLQKIRTPRKLPRGRGALRDGGRWQGHLRPARHATRSRDPLGPEGAHSVRPSRVFTGVVWGRVAPPAPAERAARTLLRLTRPSRPGAGAFPRHAGSGEGARAGATRFSNPPSAGAAPARQATPPLRRQPISSRLFLAQANPQRRDFERESPGAAAARGRPTAPAEPCLEGNSPRGGCPLAGPWANKGSAAGGGPGGAWRAAGREPPS